MSKPKFTPITVQITVETQYERDMVHRVIDAMAPLDSGLGSLTQEQFDFVWKVMLCLRNGIATSTEYSIAIGGVYER